MSNHKKPEDDNDGIHIDRIVKLVACIRHKADVGQACWNIGSNQGILKAICDKRARLAGANAPVTPYIKNPGVIHKKKDHS